MRATMSLRLQALIVGAPLCRIAASAAVERGSSSGESRTMDLANVKHDYQRSKRE